MLELIGKSNIKLIESMVDVVYFNTDRPFSLERAKHSRRGAYELMYNSWINQDTGYDEFDVRLEHYGTVIFDYQSRDGFGKLQEIYVCSDSDRNAINTLINYLGLVPVTIWRSDWNWYVKMPTQLDGKNYRVPGRDLVFTRDTWTKTYKFD